MGGNLKQVVSESYDMIRDKIDIELEINTIVASGRNELNIMAALPFLVVLMMKATSDSTGTNILDIGAKIIGIVLIGIAYLIGLKMTKIKI